MNAPDISIVIPVHNRGDVIRYTLESVRRASAGLAVETIVVDDGSTTPVAPAITRLGYAVTKLIRQENRGLLLARLAGLDHVAGRHTLFLDSDDLMTAEKLRAQIAAMDAGAADVSYTDTARTTLEGDYDALQISLDAPTRDTADPAEFFISVQPGPHNPVWRTDYLRRVVSDAFIPASPLYNPVAEIWFYHNAAIRPARIVKVSGAHTIVGQHPGARLTNHWEKLGVASLAVMEAFARHCPDTSETARARQCVAAKAFQAWRRLPRGFSPEFAERELAVWRKLDSGGAVTGLGGASFQLAARLLGPVLAGRLFRWWRNGGYESCRTVSDPEVARMLAALPAP